MLGGTGEIYHSASRSTSVPTLAPWGTTATLQGRESTGLQRLSQSRDDLHGVAEIATISRRPPWGDEGTVILVATPRDRSATSTGSRRPREP